MHVNIASPILIQLHIEKYSILSNMIWQLWHYVAQMHTNWV